MGAKGGGEGHADEGGQDKAGAPGPLNGHRPHTRIVIEHRSVHFATVIPPPLAACPRTDDMLCRTGMRLHILGGPPQARESSISGYPATEGGGSTREHPSRRD